MYRSVYSLTAVENDERAMADANDELPDIGHREGSLQGFALRTLLLFQQS